MTADKIKVRDLAPTAVRLTPEMRHALAREAAINGRSLHGEIVHRLKESMTDSGNSAPLLANEPNAVPLAPDSERALLTYFRRLSPERQLALLSLIKP